MNSFLAKLILKTGAGQRNPGLFNKVEELKESDFLSREKYESIQAQKLEHLIKFVKSNSAYYNERLSDNNCRLEDFPILSKSDLLNNLDTMNCYGQFEKLIKAETSGSTGQPFQFFKNLSWDTANRASFIRSYNWYGVNPWDRNGYFWGYSLNSKKVLKTKFQDILQNRFRAFNYDSQHLKQFLEKLKSASYLHGYSSMIYEVSQIALEMGYGPEDFPKLKLVKGTSEKIYDYYHEAVNKAFGLKMVSEYGSAEGGIIAFECPEGNMHVNEENVIVEEVEGNAIVTNLNAYSLPIIRYDTGDAIKIDSQTTCSCGRNSKIITEVLGRVGKKIIGRTKSFPSLTLYYVFKNISLEKGVDLQYQAIQSKKGELKLKITKTLESQQEAWIKEQLKMYFQNEMDVFILDNQVIHDKKGKLKDFISEIE